MASGLAALYSMNEFRSGVPLMSKSIRPLLPVMAQFHLSAGKCKWVFGVGPMFSYCIGKDSYYIDAVPDHWLNGKEKLNDFSVGVQPSIMFEFWKMRIGVEGNIGLTNVRKKYDYNYENTYIHGIVGTVNFHF